SGAAVRAAASAAAPSHRGAIAGPSRLPRGHDPPDGAAVLVPNVQRALRSHRHPGGTEGRGPPARGGEGLVAPGGVAPGIKGDEGDTEPLLREGRPVPGAVEGHECPAPV